MSLERRRFPRAPIEGAALLRVGRAVYPVETVNASMNGVLLQATPPARPGAACRLWLDTMYGRVFALGVVARTEAGRVAVRLHWTPRVDEDCLARLLTDG